MTAPHSPPSPDDTTHKTNLNLAHIAAAALAAVTAAVLGSELGVTGTLVGAAGASVITTIGTGVYQASLERSRERVRSLAQRTQPSPTSPKGSKTERFHPTAANAPLGDKRLTNSTDHGPQPWDRSRRFTTPRWGSVAMGTLGGFVLAMMVITGFEWASGETVGGNGKGTTIGQIVNDQPSPRKPAIPPPPHSSTGPTSETPTETTEAPDTTTPTTTPDGSAGVEHSPPKTSDRPAPSEVTTTPPLIQLPGVGG